MTVHDRLCPWRKDRFGQDHNHCQCPLLAEVRADERERIAQAIEVACDFTDHWPHYDRAARIARGES